MMNELKAIAEINEEIKSIVHAAESISLTATNAILVARRAVNNAVGFNVVARELRIFSEKMALTMQGLSELIYRQVSLSASKRHRMRKIALLVKASSIGGLPQQKIVMSYTQSLVDVSELERLLKSLLRELQMTIRHTGKLCATGIVIARSASIEAAHGGAMSLTLRQIAEGVESVIENKARMWSVSSIGFRNCKWVPG